MARRVNDYGADLVQKRPDRFGYFATLPLPDVHASLVEMAHAFDALRVDGFPSPAPSKSFFVADYGTRIVSGLLW
jgi:predicted TIM-barrel fold metal-dependent hydrolase